MEYDLKKVSSMFDIKGEFVSCKPYGEGHINRTFLLKTTEAKYILQRINSGIFKEPDKLMDNILAVTGYLRKIISGNGGDPERETLTVVPTAKGEPFYVDGDGNYFRVYIFIDGATTYQTVEKPGDFYHSAKAFGKFQKLLADFPADKLYEILPDFHNTPKRYENLKKAIAEDRSGRLAEVMPEVEFALAREKEADIIVSALKEKRIPLRVTHNDTKLNNVMIDDKTGEGICVIDLDTVMPGSLLYDFGDSIRFGTNPAAEDEPDLSKVNMRLDLYNIYVKGYLEELGESITPLEKELLPVGAKLMTLECGVRFLTDYLEGDVYFRIHYEKQNLDRTRTQFKLVSDMEKNFEELKRIGMEI